MLHCATSACVHKTTPITPTRWSQLNIFSIGWCAYHHTYTDLRMCAASDCSETWVIRDFTLCANWNSCCRANSVSSQILWYCIFCDTADSGDTCNLTASGFLVYAKQNSDSGNPFKFHLRVSVTSCVENDGILISDFALREVSQRKSAFIYEWLCSIILQCPRDPPPQY